MTTPGGPNPYANAEAFFSQSAPAWVVSDEDKKRIQSYDLYEAMYWSNPNVFQIVQRGEDANPIYLPCARSIIETTNRFLAVDWDFVVSPEYGTREDQGELFSAMMQLFRREEIYTKFATQRRYCLIRGDAVWHITADLDKPAGKRISIHEVDPRRYFPIMAGERRVGVHLVDEVPDPRDPKKLVNRRQTYRKDDKNSTITSEVTHYEIGKWDDRDPANTVTKVPYAYDPVTGYGDKPLITLPTEISALPVYHIKNSRIPGWDYGSSELRGVETVLAAVNQAVSDSELTLAMQGLGVYWTTAGPPEDEDGNEGNIEIGPGRVIEVPTGESFGRVNGVSSISPFVEHADHMTKSVDEALGLSDVAKGRSDVQVAESGIALYLQLAPLLAKNAEKELELLSVTDHMLYDISRAWLPAYEGVGNATFVEVASVTGDPMPANRAADILEITQLVAANLITVEMAQAKLAKMGYEFPKDAAEQVLSQASRLASAKFHDPYANRFDRELAELQGSDYTADRSGGSATGAPAGGAPGQPAQRPGATGATPAPAGGQAGAV